MKAKKPILLVVMDGIGFSKTGLGDAVTIQYGGSMNAKNAEELVKKPNVDGGLIGGASLKAPDFTAIIKAAEAN